MGRDEILEKAARFISVWPKRSFYDGACEFREAFWWFRDGSCYLVTSEGEILVSESDWHQKRLELGLIKEEGEEVSDKVGMQMILSERTGFYSNQTGEITYLDAGKSVHVLGEVSRMDNGNPLATITDGFGFASINPDFLDDADQITPEQKAIDDLFQYSGVRSRDGGHEISKDIFEAIKQGKISHITYTGESDGN